MSEVIDLKTTKGPITKITGLEEGSDEVIIETLDGTHIRQKHYQDCCESVYVSQVDNNPSKFIGATILGFEERTQSGSSYSDNGDDYSALNPDEDYEPESWTATFYTLKTDKGFLDWRWQGESNGYYSESVDTEVIPAELQI